MSFASCTHLVVGAGFWGAVIAERIASVLDEPVTIIDKRTHIGGNSHSAIDPETGIECHSYGTHIFHTRLPKVWDYISRFSAFSSYRHKVLTTWQGQVYPMPISLATINQYFKSNLKPCEVPDFIRAQAADAPAAPSNLEEKAIALIGRPLYEAFIKGYTWKQWQTDPRQLPAEIITRLPVRSSYNTDYFDDPWQGMPIDGYGRLFERLLDQPKIHLHLGVDYKDIAELLPPSCRVFYTGPPDALFDYALGALEWRSLRFERRVEQLSDAQGTSVMNYADLDVPWTRIHEFKHLHPERPVFATNRTVLCTEYSLPGSQNNEPYYPVSTPANLDLLERYRQRAAEIPGLRLGGRLGLYTYFDMDRTIESALTAFDQLCLERQASGHGVQASFEFQIKNAGIRSNEEPA